MIHLKLRFLKKWTPSEELLEVVNNVPEHANGSIKTLPDSFKGGMVIVRTDQDEMATGFSYEDENKNLHILLEAHPCVSYFHLALQYQVHTSVFKEKMLKTTFIDSEDNLKNINIYDNVNAVQSFYACASVCAIFLFNSLESFVNLSIEKCKGTLNKDGVELQKQQILLKSSFEEKAKNYLNQIFGKNFASQYGHKFEVILKLKELRDRATHVKTDSFETAETYQKLITNALNFDFKKAIEYSEEFINFYESGLIEVCNCKGTVHN